MVLLCGRNLVTPHVPSVPLAAGEHLQIWTGAYPLHQIEKLVGFFAVLSSRPFKPRSTCLTKRIVNGSAFAAQQHLLSVALELPRSQCWLRPCNHLLRFKTPCPRNGVPPINMLAQHPQPQMALVAGHRMQLANFWQRQCVVVCLRTCPVTILRCFPPNRISM